MEVVTFFMVIGGLFGVLGLAGFVADTFFWRD